ncbi:hypothetical protein RRG08_021010 [Elysia crispata]|uniref:Uncharacterized protein n=1 Tax=Elysia crispata TaxID=231223 RepID=A0AAE1ABL6_9GAST|nr:hypothetical protein RRG08_021010 [Elysia crispata]
MVQARFRTQIISIVTSTEIRHVIKRKTVTSLPRVILSCQEPALSFSKRPMVLVNLEDYQQSKNTSTAGDLVPNLQRYVESLKVLRTVSALDTGWI